MADPLLTTLCSICHAAPPKYVCPGCAASTCSLPCSQRHKAWANCSGRRDPTAYVPPQKLKTPAGVDHDYNFLSAIERERDRNQREMVEDRRLFTERQLREMDEPRRWRRMWFGEEVRFVSKDDRAAAAGVVGSDGEDDDGASGEDGGRPGGGVGNNKKTSSLVRKVRQRLDQAGIEVVHMPAGMSRQRENTTAWNRRAGRINWCVEWLVFDEVSTTSDDGDSKPQTPTRIRHKALESTPIYRALGNSIAFHEHGKKKGHGGYNHDDSSDDDIHLSASARKRRRVLVKEVKEASRRTTQQDADSSVWVTTPYATQNPYTGAWDADRAAAVSSWLPDEAIEARREHRFFLLRPLTPVGKPKELIPLGADETLSQALSGRTVLEFPTVCVLPPARAQGAEREGEQQEEMALPVGYVLSSAERRPHPQRRPKPEKRKAGPRDNNNPSKRQALHDDDGSLPVRSAGRHQQQRGRGGRGGARGRGGRFQGQEQRARRQGAEEGEINSDGDEVANARADTSSSDPDSSSDDEEEGEVVDMRGKFAAVGSARSRPLDVVSTMPAPPSAAARAASTMTSAASTSSDVKVTPGLGLVDYGSDSGDDSQSDGLDEGDDVDLAGLKPENPELVAGAIQEIVGLLS